MPNTPTHLTRHATKRWSRWRPGNRNHKRTSAQRAIFRPYTQNTFVQTLFKESAHFQLLLLQQNERRQQQHRVIFGPPQAGT